LETELVASQGRSEQDTDALLREKMPGCKGRFPRSASGLGRTHCGATSALVSRRAAPVTVCWQRGWRCQNPAAAQAESSTAWVRDVSFC